MPEGSSAVRSARCDFVGDWVAQSETSLALVPLAAAVAAAAAGAIIRGDYYLRRAGGRRSDLFDRGILKFLGRRRRAAGRADRLTFPKEPETTPFFIRIGNEVAGWIYTDIRLFARAGNK